MEQRKTITYKLVDSGRITKEFQGPVPAPKTFQPFGGWTSQNEELKKIKRSQKTLVNFQLEPDILPRKPRQRSARATERKKDSFVRMNFDADLSIPHKDPYLNDFVTILSRHVPSTILHYRKSVTEKMISLYNMTNDINQATCLAYLYQNQPPQQPSLVVRTPTPIHEAARYYTTESEVDKISRRKAPKVLIQKTPERTVATKQQRFGNKLPDINDMSFLGLFIKTKSLLPTVKTAHK